MHNVVGAVIVLMPALALLAATAQPLAAQDYFVPGQPRGGAPATTPRPTPRPVAPRPPGPPPQQQGQPQGPQGQPVAEQEPPPVQLPMPPVPELPPLARGVAPPAAVIGVIGVPDVMRASTAAQQIDRIIGERREKLNEDAQKEQGIWRDLQQSLANQRNTMSPDQVRTKERELQERITSAQRQFRDRNRIIQEAAQVGLNQIQVTLIAIIRQVADTRGMNLVLHRAQVALNINEFDITEQVTTQMNRLLPQVSLPADGISPVGQPVQPVQLVVSAAAPVATPAAAPATGATPPAPPKPAPAPSK